MTERDPNYLRSLRDELLAEGSRDPIETLVGIQNVEWHAEQLTLAADHITTLEAKLAEAEALVERAGEAMRGEVRGSGGSILYNCKQQRFTAWASASEAKSYPTLRSTLAALAGEGE